MSENRKSTLKRLIHLMLNYKLLLTIIFILSIVQVSLTVYLPILIGRAVDVIVGAGAVEFEILKTILIQMVIVVLVNTVVQWILPVMYQKIAEKNSHVATRARTPN